MLKEIPLWKKISFFIVLLIVMTRIFYITARGEIAKKYDTSDEIDITKAQEIPCTGGVQKFRP